MAEQGTKEIVDEALRGLRASGHVSGINEAAKAVARAAGYQLFKSEDRSGNPLDGHDADVARSYLPGLRLAIAALAAQYGLSDEELLEEARHHANFHRFGGMGKPHTT